MNIRFVDVDSQLERHPQFFHDREKQGRYLTTEKGFKNVEHFELDIMYRFHDSEICELCSRCEADLESGWGYCPYCGERKPEEIYISEPTVSRVKYEYKSITRKAMTPEQENRIRASYVLRVWSTSTPQVPHKHPTSKRGEE